MLFSLFIIQRSETSNGWLALLYFPVYFLLNVGHLERTVVT